MGAATRFPHFEIMSPILTNISPYHQRILFKYWNLFGILFYMEVWPYDSAIRQPSACDARIQGSRTLAKYWLNFTGLRTLLLSWNIKWHFCVRLTSYLRRRIYNGNILSRCSSWMLSLPRPKHFDQRQTEHHSWNGEYAFGSYNLITRCETALEQVLGTSTSVDILVQRVVGNWADSSQDSSTPKASHLHTHYHL